MASTQSSLDDDLEKIQFYSKEEMSEYTNLRLPALIRSLSSCRQDPVDAVKSSCILFEHCLQIYDDISTAEKQILSPALGFLEQLYDEMFTNIDKQLKNDMLDVVRGLLQVVVSLVGCTKSCVLFYTNFEQVRALDMEVFCKGTFPGIVKVVQHCNSSSKIYGDLAEVLADDLSCLLNEAGDLVSKLIVLFRDAVQFNLKEREYEAYILPLVAEFFGEVCVISQVLGVKTMIECWKFFSLMTGRYAESLTASIKIDEPVGHLAREVSRLAALSTEQASDAKLAERTLKIASFMLRLLMGLLESGYSKSLKTSLPSVVDLIIALEGFSGPALAARDVEANPTIQMVERQLLIGVGSIIASLVPNQHFSKVVCEKLRKIDCKEEPISELLTACAVSHELNAFDAQDRQQWLGQECNIFKCTTQLLDKCPQALSKVASNSATCAYETSLSSSLTLAASLSPEEFSVLEQTLLETLCSSPASPWQWLFASDLWVCTVRLSSPQLCLDQINSLKLLTEDLPDSVQKRVIVGLCERLVQILPQSKRPVALEAELDSFEKKQLGEKISNLVSSPSSTNYLRALQSLNLVEEKKVSAALLDPLMQLLPFVPNGKLGEELGTTLFGLLEKLADVMKNQHLVKVLSTINVLSSPALRVKSIRFLAALSKRNFARDADHETVIKLVADNFNDLLQNSNPVVRQEAFEVFAVFALVSPCEKIVSLAVKNSQDLQNQVAKFIQKSPCSSKVPTKEVLKKLSSARLAKINQIEIEKAKAAEKIGDFNDGMFDLDGEDFQEEFFGSQASEANSEASAKGGSNSAFNSQSAVQQRQDDLPMVQELHTLVDKLVMNIGESGLSSSDRDIVFNSISRLSLLLDKQN